MKAVLVANGPFDDICSMRLRDAVGSSELVIGIDGGTRTLTRLGLTPTHVTGDFDSLSQEERDDLESLGVRIVPTPDQDFTDLDKALRFAFEELGATGATVFGATGGRLDHLYSVLSVLIKYARTRDVTLVDRVGEVFLARGSLELRGADLVGRTLSLLALGPAEGVKTTGVAWPLTAERLAPGERDGTLNVVTEETVTISCASGDLLVYLHHAA
jgi:thiamine pyrophosphokinase